MDMRLAAGKGGKKEERKNDIFWTPAYFCLARFGFGASLVYLGS
jgi:hypothetical protein